MQALTLLMFCCVCFSDFLATHLALPGALRFTPEILSVIVAGYVLFVGIRDRFALIAPRYWLVFAALVLVIICGIVANDVGSGPTIAGMRYYLRPIPFFLLPAIYRFKDRQLSTQLKLLTVIALIQVPIAAYQRWTLWNNEQFTGDLVQGTLMDSGILSIFLISCVLVLTAFFMHGRIGRFLFITLFFVLLAPTTINETKATVFLLPIGLFATLIAGTERGKRMRVVGFATLMLVGFGAIFFPVYDLMETGNPYKKDLIDFFTSSKDLNNYMDVKTAGVGTTEQVGRGDAIRIPIEYVSRDPVHMVFGLGLGNATHSNLGDSFVGAYYGLFSKFVITSFAVFVLEIGLLGTALVFVLYWLVFRDTLVVARRDESLTGSIAAAWTGVVVIITITTAYTTGHGWVSSSYLYWYFAGIMAARRSEIGLSSEFMTATDER